MYSAADIRSLEARYKKLVAEIEVHDRLYYGENSPEISDFEYDCLKSEADRSARILAAHAKEVKEITIGDDRVFGFSTATHPSPMMSLSNTYSRDELSKFHKPTEILLGHGKFSYVVEPKIDGVAINLIYRNGEFSQAITRGNGTVGDDVSANVKTVKNLPLVIENFAPLVEIRGEIYIDEPTFLKINGERKERGMERFANPRNLAAGTVKTLDVGEVEERNLRLIAYAIGLGYGGAVHLQSDTLEYLKRLGFQSQEKYWVAENIRAAWQCITELDGARHKFPHWTDGAVLKVNELDLHGKLGATAKAPRWAIAYKFAPERATTRLNAIILQVGRTGVVTPVADLDPVQLSGTNVSRATLHNGDEIAKKDMRIGDYVLVEKAGEINPSIVAVETSRRDPNSRPFAFPKTCPACGSQLVRPSNEVAWRCQNSCCPPQVRGRIEHFVSRVAMDIDGIGTSLIEKLMAQNKLKNIADIYLLTFHDLESMEKLGAKSALKILRSIDGSKNKPFWRLLHGLGILGIGEQTAKVLAKHFPSIGSLREAKGEDLEILGGIGEKLSAAILAFFGEPNNGKIADDLCALAVARKEKNQEISEDNPENGNQKFLVKNFVLTGTFPSMERREAAEIIERLGGNILPTVSKKTHILIPGKNSRSKLANAQSLGLEIWNNKEFLKNINAASPE
jgi:DNA ligase (NAD+)